jgi:hypothetical protein
MKWLTKEPAHGDIIRVRFGETFYHYGIYSSDDEVIQFGLAPTVRGDIPDSEIEVLVSDIQAFLAGGELEVGEPEPRELLQKRRAEDVISLARAKIGTKGYNILYNNCEHFANECYLGHGFCSQADVVREMFRNMPLVDVYVAKIPDTYPDFKVFPPEREAEIASVTNPRVKKEKYYAWRLLEYGLERSLGLKIKNMEFTKNSFGKWTSPSCRFSISHGGEFVAVAVSRGEVGVDIEPVAEPRSDSFAHRILTTAEFNEYSLLPEDKRVKALISYWVSKEAVFKTTDRECFIPSETEIDKEGVKIFEITDIDTNYLLAVATETPDRIRMYKDIDLRGK